MQKIELVHNTLEVTNFSDGNNEPVKTNKPSVSDEPMYTEEPAATSEMDDESSDTPTKAPIIEPTRESIPESTKTPKYTDIPMLGLMKNPTSTETPAPLSVDSITKYFNSKVNSSMQSVQPPETAKILSIKNTKKGCIVVKCNKTADISGCCIQYSTNRKFKK